MKRLLNLFLAACLMISLGLGLIAQFAYLPSISFAKNTVPRQPLTTDSEAADLAAGDAHTCALTSANSIKCWGNNANGQLGIGSLVDQSLPADVSGINDANAVVAGERHTCALLNSGAALCWGANDVGQLGNNTVGNIDQPTPVAVVGLPSPAFALAAGANHTCVVVSTGAVLCWGNNTAGQLNGTPSPASAVPVVVPALPEPAVSVAAGNQHSCALLQNGAVRCWGNNAYGQLGNGLINATGGPTGVVNLAPNIRVLSAGAWHTCAASASGALQCWGRNSAGQLGNGGTDTQPQPVNVTLTNNGITDLSLGRGHSCAMDTAGNVYCWGDNQYGQLGDGTTADSLLPKRVSGLSSAAQGIAVGSNHTCGILTDGSAYCWGHNYTGQLGNGISGRYPTPVDVIGLSSNVGSLVAASRSTCARVNGGAKCWGNNSFGQLGDGTRRDRNAPVTVVGLTSGVILLSSDGNHTCATTVSKVLCWGSNSNGQLGDGTNTDRLMPVAVEGVNGADVAAIVIGDLHTCVALFEGNVLCWGSNAYGQLGDGTTTDRNKPVDVKKLGGYVTNITAGATHSCARLLGGSLKCWGGNAFGQLGDGTRIDHILPAAVSGFEDAGAASVTASETHSCARLTDNVGVRCWGDNTYGQLGNNSTQPSLVPVDVAGLGNLNGMSVGRFHNCVITNGNTKMSCWGDNRFGQLGDGSFINRPVPVEVKTSSGSISMIGAGGSQTCAGLSGAMKCWGNDVFGQIGNGLPPDRIGPTLVQNFLEPRKRRTRTPVPTLTAIAADTTTPQPVETTDTPLPETATPTLIPGTTPSTPIPTEIATATPAGATATPQVDPPRFANIYAPLIMKGFPIFFDGPNEVEDNDTAISANGPMRLNTNYLGRPDDANDYFRFVLPRDGTVTISLIGHIAENTQNMQLQLRSASDTSIQFVFQKPFAIQRALPAGTYLVRVFYAPPGPYSTATPYTLRIGFE